MKGEDNFNFVKTENGFKISLNADFYPLEVIYSVSYVFLDKAYIWLEGDLKNIIVNILPKEGFFDKDLPLKFNNELLTHLDYKSIFNENKSIRDMLLQRAIITNDVSLEDKNDSNTSDYLEEDSESFDDLEEIIIPWEEENEEKN